MGRIRNDDLLTLQVTPRTMIVVDGHQTCQFTMRPCIGFEGEMSQSRQRTERLVEHDDQSLGTEDGLFRLQRVQILEGRQGSNLLVDLWIVLHRTGAQRVKTRIDTKVIIREVRIMAHHRQLIAFRQGSILLTAEFVGDLIITEIVTRQTIAFAARLREFEDQISI